MYEKMHICLSIEVLFEIQIKVHNQNKQRFLNETLKTR